MPAIFFAQFYPKPNQLVFNTLRIMQLMKKAKEQNASIIAFGETALQGYNVKNSLTSDRFFNLTEHCLKRIQEYADYVNLGIILGVYRKNQSVYGKPAKNGVWTYFPTGIDGLTSENSYQEKQLIPRQSELDEILYVAAGNSDTMRARTIGSKRVVYHICQDSWRETQSEIYQANPLQQALDLHADVLINFSASPWHEGKWYDILQYLLTFSAKCSLIIVYIPITGFEDQQFQFTAGGFVVHHGHIKRLLPRFVEADMLVDLETIHTEPNIDFDVSLRHSPAHKQDIKISSVYHALTVVIQALSSQYGIVQDPLLMIDDKFVEEMTPFLPEAADTLNGMRQFSKKNAKRGFAIEFTNEANVFLLIHLLRKNTPDDVKITLCLNEIADLTRKQKDFLRKHRVDIFTDNNKSFRSYARENRLLLLDDFNLTQYRIGRLDTNIYGLSLLGSLTLSIIYKLLVYCQLDSWVEIPDKTGILEQQLNDQVIKMIQRLPEFDLSQLMKLCLPYFIKKLNHNMSIEKITKLCQDKVSLVLQKSENESWNGARIKQDSIVQLTFFAPARNHRTKPPMIHELPLPWARL